MAYVNTASMADGISQFIEKLEAKRAKQPKEDVKFRAWTESIVLFLVCLGAIGLSVWFFIYCFTTKWDWMMFGLAIAFIVSAYLFGGFAVTVFCSKIIVSEKHLIFDNIYEQNGEINKLRNLMFKTNPKQVELKWQDITRMERVKNGLNVNTKTDKYFIPTNWFGTKVVATISKCRRIDNW